VPHGRPGLLSMANMGTENSNGSQWFITTNAASHLGLLSMANMGSETPCLLTPALNFFFILFFSGPTFPDESFAVPHGRPGLLSMANMGTENSNGSQWFITTNAASHLDRKHVAFGRVLRGMATIHRIENLPTDSKTERPYVDVGVADCGALDASTISLEVDDDEGVSSYGADALILAAARGDAQMAAVLTKAGAELNARIAVPVPFSGAETVEGLAFLAVKASALGQSAERTALHLAAANGHAIVVAGLLAAGADVDAVDSTGACALHLAVRDSASAACVRALIDGGADAGALTSTGASAAHLACERGDEDCLAALLAGKQAADLVAGQWAPEPKPGNEAEVNEAADATAELALGSSSSGDDAGGGLGGFVKKGGGWVRREEGLQKLDPDAAVLAAGVGGVTPLHVAAAGDKAGCVRLLLEHGAKPLGLAAGELSAVHVAAAKGALGALSALLDATGPKGAEAEGGKSGKLPIHSAAQHGSASAVRALHARGANLDAPDARGSTPLHWAALGGHARATEALIELGAAVDAPTVRGAMPLHVACEHGFAEVVEALLKAKADPNSRGQAFVVPLHAAAKSGSVRCVTLLLQAGADPEAEMNVQVNSSGHKTGTRKRAIHIAAEDGHLAVLQLLIDAKADVNALAAVESDKSTSLMSALFSAIRGKKPKAAALLQANGALEVSRVEM